MIPGTMTGTTTGTTTEPTAESTAEATGPTTRRRHLSVVTEVQDALPRLPAVMDGVVAHRRFGEGAHGFTHRHRAWLVDLDDPHPLPRGLRWLARLRPADHLDGGRLGGGIAGDVERFLAARGIERQPGERLLMLAQPRMWGQVFNPLTVFWLLDAQGESRACVLEVHNTYGSRHAYVVRLDAHDRAEVDKAFYVSPFNDTSGSYGVRISLRPDRVAVSVVLWRDGERILSAVQSGELTPLTARSAATASLARPWANLKVPALIRWHGVRLWARRLPVQPRPPQATDLVR